jgi:hypothetical protein
MKTLLIAALLLLCSWAIGFAQPQSMTFEEAKEIGIYDKLDSTYRGGIGSDSSQSIFKNVSQYTKSYQDFLGNLAAYLSKNNFKWGKQIRCFNKIYFSKEGKVDYFLYNFKEGQMTKQQEQQFAHLLATFIQNARFGLSASVPFAQCSPVKYEDK